MIYSNSFNRSTLTEHRSSQVERWTRAAARCTRQVRLVAAAASVQLNAPAVADLKVNSQSKLIIKAVYKYFEFMSYSHDSE